MVTVTQSTHPEQLMDQLSRTGSSTDHLNIISKYKFDKDAVGKFTYFLFKLLLSNG